MACFLLLSLFIIIMDTCDLKGCGDVPPAVILWWMLADVLTFSPDVTEDSVRIYRLTVQFPRVLHPHNHAQAGAFRISSQLTTG